MATPPKCPQLQIWCEYDIILSLQSQVAFIYILIIFPIKIFTFDSSTHSLQKNAYFCITSVYFWFNSSMFRVSLIYLFFFLKSKSLQKYGLFYHLWPIVQFAIVCGNYNLPKRFWTCCTRNKLLSFLAVQPAQIKLDFFYTYTNQINSRFFSCFFDKKLRL